MTNAKILAAIVFSITICTSSSGAEENAEIKPIADRISALTSDDGDLRSAACESFERYYCYLLYPAEKFDDNDPIAELNQAIADVRPHFATLKEVLRSEYAESAATAAYLLALLGSDAESVSPTLIEFISSAKTDNNLRMAAAHSLLHVTPTDKPVLPIFLKAYRDHLLQGEKNNDADEEEDLNSIQGAGISSVFVVLCLAQSGRTIIEVPSLVELASDKYPRLYRAIALCTLCELGEDAKEAIPSLRKMLVDKDADLREAAAGALLCIQGNSDELPEILNTLQLSDKRKAEFEEMVLRKLDVLKIFEVDGQDEIKEPTDPDWNAELMNSLVWQLKDGKPYHQRGAIRELAKMGSKAKSAIPDLRAVAASSEKATRETAAAAIDKINNSPDEPQDRKKK